MAVSRLEIWKRLDCPKVPSTIEKFGQSGAAVQSSTAFSTLTHLYSLWVT